VRQISAMHEKGMYAVDTPMYESSSLVVSQPVAQDPFPTPENTPPSSPPSRRASIQQAQLRLWAEQQQEQQKLEQAEQAEQQSPLSESFNEKHQQLQAHLINSVTPDGAIADIANTTITAVHETSISYLNEASAYEDLLQLYRTESEKSSPVRCQNVTSPRKLIGVVSPTRYSEHLSSPRSLEDRGMKTPQVSRVIPEYKEDFSKFSIGDSPNSDSNDYYYDVPGIGMEMATPSQDGESKRKILFARKKSMVEVLPAMTFDLTPYVTSNCIPRTLLSQLEERRGSEDKIVTPLTTFHGNLSEVEEEKISHKDANTSHVSAPLPFPNLDELVLNEYRLYGDEYLRTSPGTFVMPLSMRTPIGLKHRVSPQIRADRIRAGIIDARMDGLQGEKKKSSLECRAPTTLTPYQLRAKMMQTFSAIQSLIAEAENSPVLPLRRRLSAQTAGWRPLAVMVLTVMGFLTLLTFLAILIGS